MCDSHDIDGEKVVVNIVKNTDVAHANTPRV